MSEKYRKIKMKKYEPYLFKIEEFSLGGEPKIVIIRQYDSFLKETLDDYKTYKWIIKGDVETEELDE